MTGRALSGSQRPAPAISLADPQSMKCVPPRSKTSRPGLSRVASASWAARNGIVTRSSSPLTTIVVIPGQASTSIVTRLSCTGPAGSSEHSHVMRLPFSSIEQDSAGCCQGASSCRMPGRGRASIDRAAGRRGLGGIMTAFSMPHFARRRATPARPPVTVWPDSWPRAGLRWCCHGMD